MSCAINPADADYTHRHLHVDLDRLRDASGDDEEILLDLVRLYMDDTTRAMDSLSEAVANRDSGLIRSVAHSCAGAAAVCGMIALEPLFRTLETIGYNQTPTLAVDAMSHLDREFMVVMQILRTHEAHLSNHQEAQCRTS